MRDLRGADRLLALHDIRDLAYRYAHAFLALDPDLMLSLWEDVSDPAPAPGLDIHWARACAERFDDLRAAITASGRGATMLHVTNHLIRFEDDARASGRVQCVAQLDRGHSFIEQAILYEDRYRCVQGSWLFRTRRHLLWFGAAGAASPLDQPPARWPESQVGADNLLADMTPFPDLLRRP